MVVFGQKTHFWLKYLLVAQLVGVIVGGYHFWHVQARYAFQEAFEATIRQNASTIQRRLTALENKLLALRAFYRSSVDVTPPEFASFLESLPLTEFDSKHRGGSVKLWLWIAADGGTSEPSLIASGEKHSSSELQKGAFHNAVRKFCSNLREDLCTSSERQFLMPASFLGAPLDTAHYHHVALVQPIWHEQRAIVAGRERLRGLLIAITDLGEVLSTEAHAPMGYLQGAALLSAPLTVIASQTMEDPRFDLRKLTVFGTLEKTSVFSLANGSMSVDWSLSALEDIKILTVERVLFLLAAAIVTVIGWSITNGLHALNLSLARERDRSQLAVEAKSQFVAKISHEIRTPLNAIMGMADLINKDPLTRKQQRYLRELNWSADGLTKLIDDLLDFSKMEARQITLEALTVDLESFFYHVSNSVAPRFREKGVVFYLNMDARLPRQAMLDTHRVRQVVLNLLTNAAKFTARGQVGLLVRPAEVQDDGGKMWLEICVKGTGIGIPQEARDRIFEKFAQADDSTTRVYGGTGLGLAIVKELVDIMGGHISVSGEYGSGSVFTVTLPFDPVPADQIAELQASEADVVDEAPALVEPSPRIMARQPLQILVAEDDRVNRIYMQELLKGMGHVATFAHNGHEAVELASARRFDVVLMDCQMPLCDGYEASRRLRAAGPGTIAGDAVILALTANAQPDERQKCLAAGMNDFLTKPIRESTLAAALAAWRKPGNSITDFAHDTGSTPVTDEKRGITDAQVPRELTGEAGWLAPQDATVDTGVSGDGEVVTSLRAAHLELIIAGARLDALRQSMGQSYATMLSCFVEDLSKYSAALPSAFGSRNYAEARRIAHSLKSTSLLVGAVGLSEEARELEQLLMNVPVDHDCDEIEARITAMAGTITQVAAHLQDQTELKAA